MLISDMQQVAVTHLGLRGRWLFTPVELRSRWQLPP
jgi:hypothetical protein